MEKTHLSGIERELVLQYLIDGNVPVTLTPVAENDSGEKGIHSVDSVVFPVAIKGEKVKVSKNGKITLENPPQSVLAFSGKTVKVEFYFNRVGVYFTSLAEERKKGLVLNLPDVIDRIVDEENTQKYDFTATLYFECRTQSELNISCIPFALSPLFTRPVWKQVPLDNQQKAKRYLEMFVEQAKIEKNAGNGIQLIPVCNYLTYQDQKIEAVQNRVKPLNILYVDHERIVFGGDGIGFTLVNGAEYALKLSFMFKEGPLISRDMFVTCKINKIYNEISSSKFCADCVYTTVKEEDMRFLYEKATSRLFA